MPPGSKSTVLVACGLTVPVSKPLVRGGGVCRGIVIGPADPGPDLDGQRLGQICVIADLDHMAGADRCRRPGGCARGLPVWLVSDDERDHSDDDRNDGWKKQGAKPQEGYSRSQSRLDHATSHFRVGETARQDPLGVMPTGSPGASADEHTRPSPANESLRRR